MPEYEGPKAITTLYNGYRFRSRLEARWAVFFDTLGIAYEYEKEGYDLGGGLLYLPDFWLPTLELWFEVKGDWVRRGDDDWLKAERLVMATKHDVVVFGGQISPMKSWVMGFRFAAQSDPSQLPDARTVWWMRCRFCGQCEPVTFSSEIACDCLALRPEEQRPIDEALDAARQARFEHGEKPRGPRER